MTKLLEGKHALVTGGAGGIGAAIAAALGQYGATVTLVGRDPARLEQAAGRMTNAHTATADVRDADSVAQAFARARAHFGEVNILINAAGAATSAPVAKTSVEDWQNVLAVNLSGVFHTCREAVGPMLESGFGRIVNVASTAGLRGYRYVAAYCAAKHGVVGFTRALALETAAKGVTVNAVCPAYTQTPMLDETIATIGRKTKLSAQEAVQALLAQIPRKAFVKTSEVANAALWLCLPGSEAVTGQAIAVDGGELAG